MYTTVCRRRPAIVGQPFIATVPTIPLNNEFVKLYVYGFTTKRKINAEKRVICHFCEELAI